MNRQAPGLVSLGRAVVEAVRSDRITFIAASLAYYGFISLLPLMLLALVAASVIGGPELAAEVGAEVAASLGPQAGDLVVDALTDAAGRGGATVVGIGVLLWSGLKLFRGMDVAFSTIYGTASEESFLDQLRDASVTLLGVGFGLVVTLVVGIATAQFDRVVAGVDVFNVVGSVVLLVGLTAAFLPLYYVLPDRGGITVREAVPGALFAAVGWVALTTGFRIYAGVATSYQAYGVLGGVLLLVTFLYFGGLILLVGVVLNAVIAGRIDEGTNLDLPEELRDLVDRPETAAADGEQLSGRATFGGIDVADDEELESEIRALREELAEMEERVDERTVHREDIERDLKKYVRSRVRRGKARGWGPYLVLLYGTGMTLGAFYFLSGGWAILAMLVVWLSTLGLYVLMLIVGVTVGVAGLPGKLKERVDDIRS
ncbi:YihY/virulence factor BrkB family protein [Halorarius litoreus]|uniref:YihY/virulence factor BrkB family protein n=1 Tax=Halorarius litoreus TaxID=2962676 RepID=UPI0020CBB855|nr:YihY/virulence factor BrkB family protein [Halorarius litoreus]